MKRISEAGVWITILMLGWLMFACSRDGDATTTSVFTPSVLPSSAPREGPDGSQEILDRGAVLYSAHGQVCHGDREGRGTSGRVSPHNETGHTWHHPDAQLRDWVLNGKPPGLMPPFKPELAEGQVEAVLAYIKTWWTEDQRLGQADMSQRYQQALDKQKTGK